MAGTLPVQQTWHQELDLLTRFHRNNKGVGLVQGDDEALGGNLEAHSISKQSSVRVKSLGRGSKVSSHDDSLLARQVVEFSGRGQRVECGVDSTKSDLSMGNNSPQMTTTPRKKVKDDQRVSTRPKLIKKNSSSSEGKYDSGSSCKEVRSLGRGRGRKADSSAVELPVGAVANMIQQNVGQGHRLEFGQSGWVPQGNQQRYPTPNNNDVNSPSYFPKFDYGQYNILNKPAWWASSSAVGRTDQLNSQEKKMKEKEKVLVKRAVLSNWTPLDDSV